MDALNSALLINLLGFTLGVALYVLLFAMVLRHRRRRKENSAPDFLLLTTAVLGILWNFGELFVFIWRDFGRESVSPIITAIAYSALGFLPSVVVHSTWKNSETRSRNLFNLTILAYCLSTFATILHVGQALFSGLAPSGLALQVLTFGSLVLLLALLGFNFRQKLEKKMIWVTALLVFFVSGLHLSGDAEEKSWLIELVTHQTSLPLALAILLQEFRFAFADLFLKRALSLILLTLTAFGLYVFVAAPLLHFHETHDRNDVQAISLIITLWVATALIYPFLHRLSVWTVDKILLRRVDYKILQNQIAKGIEVQDDPSLILDRLTSELGAALTANEANWTESDKNYELRITNYELQTGNSIEILIPTAESPFYQINLRDFVGGRRLLSDEIEMLENVALLVARRIDALRVSHERYEQEIREQQTAKLATEAELRALRAQLNPHFLFNALTTIGYLIQTAPEKAVETLMRLTQLLRGVLRSTGEFSTLGDEIKLIESYLEIERARFEERLSVKIDVSPELQRMRIPSLILQPLVENAVKHGISNSKKGGEVKISACVEGQNLMLEVTDTGAGVDKKNLIESRQRRVGLNNIEQRLQSHYGKAASFEIESEIGEGTKSKIVLPIAASKDVLPQNVQRN
jgi:two-component system, LytTR family, sensor kinase